MKSQPIGGLSLRVFAETNETPRHLALELVGHGKEGGMGTAIPCRDTESGRIPDHDVCSPFSGRLELGQGQEISRGNNQSTELVRRLCKCGPILDVAINVRVLNKNTTDVRLEAGILNQSGGIANNDVNLDALGTRPDDCKSLGGNS